ncbi:DUF6624 domain-containing protein [Spartinivicinus poritis]|uniref:Uncharacterized protein n=1 Tax=Spartinivicinus poritis TaxID=2994640 RepID=A0ABT5UHQ8_9GAMM|nr:DUF6624 domain-containing protein [Spartinivicinus sp. A2-2]MDE1465042.1 hypothetical protein [Spartinivicinus sp. A2-2]
MVTNTASKDINIDSYKNSFLTSILRLDCNKSYKLSNKEMLSLASIIEIIDTNTLTIAKNKIYNCYKSNDIEGYIYAQVIDKITLHKSNKQVYGSQVNNKNWTYKSLYTISNNTNIDQKRSELGLVSLSIVNKIINLENKDQQLRKAYISEKNKYKRKNISLKMNFTGVESEEFILKITKEYGLLTPSMLGFDAYNSYFTLIQHLSKKSFLILHPYILDAYKSDKISPNHYALYIDRYNVYNGFKQKFGTQYNSRGDLLPVENKAILPILRKKMHLYPFDITGKSYNKLYKEKI